MGDWSQLRNSIPIDDDRFQPGAYVRNDRKVFEVYALEGRLVVMHDIEDGRRWTVQAHRLFSSYELVRKAPSCPDSLDSLD